MKKLTIILIILTIFDGCKIFQPPIDNASKIYAIALIPDTCEMSLIERIRTFRIYNQKFPNNQDIEKLNQPCQKSINSIESFSYNKDSMDFVFQKSINDSTLKIRSMRKCYRLIFVDDTLKELRILHNNKNYKSELLEK